MPVCVLVLASAVIVKKMYGTSVLGDISRFNGNEIEILDTLSLFALA